MDYNHVYTNLIANAQKRSSIIGYYEIHHIIPRSLGGGDDMSNLVELTAKEHFIAHLLLAKIYGGKMAVAAFIMSQYKKYKSRKYAWLKEGFSQHQRSTHTGKTHTNETKLKMSGSKKGSKNNFLGIIIQMNQKKKCPSMQVIDQKNIISK